MPLKATTMAYETWYIKGELIDVKTIVTTTQSRATQTWV